MNLSKEQIINLGIIRHAEGECIAKEQFINIKGQPHQDVDGLISELEALDLIELDGGKYYLTTEAYDVLEYYADRIENPQKYEVKPHLAESIIQMTQHANKRPWWTKLVYLFLFCLMAVSYKLCGRDGYFTTNYNEERIPVIKLSKENLEQIKSQSNLKSDTIAQ